MGIHTSKFGWPRWTPWCNSVPPHMEQYECIFRSGDDLTEPKERNTAGHHQRPVITVQLLSAFLHLKTIINIVIT